jgi:hypothetical protein
MMLNPFGLILTLLGRLLGIGVPQYRPPSQPAALGNRIQLQSRRRADDKPSSGDNRSVADARRSGTRGGDSGFPAPAE